VATLVTTLGCLLLLANPHPKNILSPTFLQEQGPPPAQPSPEQSQPTVPSEAQTTEQAAPETPKAVAVTPQKSAAKASAKKRTGKKKPHPAENSIVVVRNGGSSDKQGQISFSATDQQTLEKRKNTDTLLHATATNLQQISTKQLNPSQQDMVKQIHNYMSQSKEATRTGDIQGAYNLAVKAHLLSEELVKP